MAAWRSLLHDMQHCTCALHLLKCLDACHDIAPPTAMPAACRRRLLRQLDASGIVDVGLLAPDASRGFFAACKCVSALTRLRAGQAPIRALPGWRWTYCTASPQAVQGARCLVKLAGAAAAPTWLSSHTPPCPAPALPNPTCAALAGTQRRAQ